MDVELTCLIICLITIMVSASYSRGHRGSKTVPLITGTDPILRKQILDFLDFKNKFNRTYDTNEEQQKAQRNLANNIALITLHNQQFLSGESLYEMGEWELSDMSAKEINDALSGLLQLNQTIIDHEKARATTIIPTTEELLTCEYTVEPAIQERVFTKAIPIKTTQKPSIPLSADWRSIFNPVRFQGRDCGSCWGMDIKISKTLFK